MHIMKTTRTMIAALALGLFTASAGSAWADEVKAPQTTAEHEAMAKQYKEQAAQYRKVAEDHKAMAEAYKKSVATPEMKGGQKNPWLVKMEKHCAVLAKDAEKLAVDAEKAADFHSLRAKELQGK